MRVLLTGATGFLGRHCLPLLLDRGVEVHATTRGPRQPEGTGVTWHQADLLDDQAVRAVVADVSPSHLVHLAWDVTPGAWADAPAHMDWTAASLTLLRAFSDAGGQRAVFAGSCAEYDWSQGLCSEDGRTVPATLYGASKRALGLIAESYAARAGVSLAWARVFFVYGPHEPAGRLVPTVARAMLTGNIAECTSGTQCRDFLYVGDVARALTTLLWHEAVGPFNVGSGRATAVRDIVLTIADKLNGRHLVAFGARSAAGEPPVVTADIARLNALGWSPQYTLEAGLDQTIDWWRAVLAAESAGVS
jgi:nucleoside-diphosphate-sugar epimerase